MSHKEILALLMPLELGGAHQADLEAEGAALDRAHVSAQQLLLELHADTTDRLIARWERTYGIVPDPAKPLYLRRQLLTARVAARGGLSVSYLQGVLASFLGYAPYIEEHHVPRCDDPSSRTDDERFALDPELVWQFHVWVDNSALQTAGYSLADMQKIIDELKPAHTQGLIETGQTGVFCDDPYSVTDLTPLAL